MKKLFNVVLTCLSIVVSCNEFDDSTIWDKLDEHEDRIARLEELCKQMNTNITSLQSILNALQNNDYVTAVVPVTTNGDIIGYTYTMRVYEFMAENARRIIKSIASENSVAETLYGN